MDEEDFSDIRVLADLVRLAHEDWDRYLRWHAAQRIIRDEKFMNRYRCENG